MRHPILGLLFFLSACAAAPIAPALATDPDGEYAQCQTEVCKWYRNLMQPDNVLVSCCGEADAFEADLFEVDDEGRYVAIITNGRGVIATGTRIVIPPKKIKWDQGNPTGHGIVFMSGNRDVYCYCPPTMG